jgi:hypothetical protein
MTAMLRKRLTGYRRQIRGLGRLCAVLLADLGRVGM